ncbi:MAG: hypothetical protein AB8F78_09030 [Saprospiraceae bacterium]
MNKILFFLIVVCLFAVYRIVVKVVAGRKHLTGEEFRAYMKGGKTMSDDERSRVTSHLGICDSCQAQVDEWIKGDPDDA